MRQIIGPALAVAAAVSSLGLIVTPSACVVECRSDDECGLPFRRCQLNTCVECLTKEDCLKDDDGSFRDCFHGICCDLQGDRGCYTHLELPEPIECHVDDDCAVIYGQREDGIPVLPFCHDAECNECRTKHDCDLIYPGENLCCFSGSPALCKPAPPTGCP